MTHDHGREVLLEVPCLGRATECQIAVRHSPRPLRFVWHHILPQACGGLTEVTNLVSLCDSCHYSVHRLMWLLSEARRLPPRCNTGQWAYAHAGWQRAVARGTDHLIPDEGGAFE